MKSENDKQSERKLREALGYAKEAIAILERELASGTGESGRALWRLVDAAGLIYEADRVGWDPHGWLETNATGRGFFLDCI